jgi:COP9 signalosome complex subunit 8
LKRLPESLTSIPLAVALFNLLASTWERKHARVYSRAENLLQLLEKEEFPDARPASVIAGMVTTFVGEWFITLCFPQAYLFEASFRQRTFNLLANAYSSLHMTLAQTYLGLSAEELLTRECQ